MEVKSGQHDAFGNFERVCRVLKLSLGTKLIIDVAMEAD
jgi:hypothetical protein